jgi:hypothetical protein
MALLFITVSVSVVSISVVTVAAIAVAAVAVSARRAFTTRHFVTVSLHWSSPEHRRKSVCGVAMRLATKILRI